MTPAFLNPSTSPSPKEEEDQQQHQFYNSISKAQSSSSSSSLSSQVFACSNVQDHGGTHHREVHQLKYQQDQASYFAWQSGSSSQPICESESDHHGLKFFLWKKELGGDQNENQSEKINGSAKWMPSKMRMMRKMMNSARASAEAEMKLEDQKPQPSSSPLGSTDNSSNSSSSNSNNPIIRVCADCNTTKTPLWRSGPRGPKSLCNACGIRQRKARRAMAAAAAAANGGTVLEAETASVKSKTQQKEKRSNNGGHVAQYKKRSKLAAATQGRRKLCFEDFLISMSKNLAFHHVFPQDEKEAAILLMALSCGLVHG
ncbi:putative GATA transcription factor 22 [Diospyros lotus]|uniref:putative GATA transcription factor 22 n=1 Tax=Diospyros lotus TaxID=55363 RepID=UPI002252CC17|nr:putative GATA transcription factor 22 [Diospyros lotus]